jgi:hypothetical protein
MPFHQTSGLGAVISDICKPKFILSDFLHTQGLFKTNRIQESLGLILTAWTPDPIVEAWGLDELEFCPSKVICLCNLLYPQVTREGLRPLPIWGKINQAPGKFFVDALIHNPHLIPCHLHPQAVFFLLSQGNFIHLWNAWLGHCLEHLGYDIKVRGVLLLRFFSLQRTGYTLNSGLQKILKTIFQWLRTI